MGACVRRPRWLLYELGHGRIGHRRVCWPEQLDLNWLFCATSPVCWLLFRRSRFFVSFLRRAETNASFDLPKPRPSWSRFSYRILGLNSPCFNGEYVNCSPSRHVPLITGRRYRPGLGYLNRVRCLCGGPGPVAFFARMCVFVLFIWMRDAAAIRFDHNEFR